MMEKNNGGPAFPGKKKVATATAYEETVLHPGMSLRDYFAAKAMAAFISNSALKEGVSIVDEAYRVADAMIRRRDETR